MNITSGIQARAQRVVIYGTEGIGKSTLASQFPKPLFIDTEGSTSNMDVKRLDKPTSWTMLMNQIAFVKANPDKFKTLVIDTIDWAESLAIESVCAQHGKRGIEDFGYGNGYTYVREEFGRLLNKLQELVDIGINVVLTAHSQLRKFNRKVRANLDKEKAEEEAKQYKSQYDNLSAEIQKVRDERTSLLDNADLPLPGLSVEDGELVFEGQKWDNMSGSQQLRVSTAIVRKLKPECGFVLLDKLEQMDIPTLTEFGKWLESEGLQAIATRVSSGEECQIIIEDGYVVSDTVTSFKDKEPTNKWTF